VLVRTLTFLQFKIHWPAGSFLTIRYNSRVSGHLHLCISRMEQEVIFTLRRNIPPLFLQKEAAIQALGVSQRYASQTK
jgi:hypothetical protein